jgi:nitrate/nitrite-specific signal transduction histidine kinase
MLEAQEEIETTKSALEVKVTERTKELKDLSESLDSQVREKTKKLQEKVEELERFNKLVIGRELKMLELKKEIEELKKESGK